MRNIWVLALFAIVSFSALGQNNAQTNKAPLSAPTDRKDSLRSEREMFSTAIYQEQNKLRPAAIMALYREDALAGRHYRAGQIMTPIAPLVSLAGVALTYVALKGKSGTYTGFYEGKPVTVDYTIRSRPKLAAGLGLFVAGIAMVELANGFVAKSVRGYNVRHEGQLTSNDRPTFHIGVTPSGNLGLFARF